MSQENVHWELFLCVCPPGLFLFSPLFPMLPVLPVLPVLGPFPLPLPFFRPVLFFLCPAFPFFPCMPRWGGAVLCAARLPPSFGPSVCRFLCENFCFLNLLSSSALRVLSVFFCPVGLKKVSKRFGDTEKSSTFAIPFEKWASLSGR